MSEFQPSCQNGTPGFFNRPWSGWHHYQVIGAAETIILPCLIGIICSTGLVGNILIVFTIIRVTVASTIIPCTLLMVGLIGVPPGRWIFLQTASLAERHMLYLTITTLFFPLPLIFICYILILCYSWEMYQQNKKAGNYTTSITRQRVMRLTKMVLALVSVSVVSAAPFHVIQLMNLQVSQLTLTFYVSYYVSICLSYTSSNINPFLYILPTGNFQKCLRQCTKVEVRMAEQDVSIIENILKSSF